ncbi:hypothetical protein [Flavisphingomonas formosensis]|uniref:hypothetical protein n=1 Tax=Flavisphingomonas formosensis TaxID=861534 RepID=UPI0012FB0B01|nr:hypothetical protein [Sphingomonas formosensis]
MDNAVAYWSQLLAVVRLNRCWVRVAWRDGDTTDLGNWGMSLGIPVDGYLEGPDGPWPLGNVEWVDVSMSYLKGGLAGLPLQIVNDRKGEILSGLRATQLDWELRDTTWLIERQFSEEEPVQLARIVNPFFAVRL